jgi:putative transposase
MFIAHKIALDLNNRQRTYMARAAGCARYAYNWALAQWGKQYKAWKLNNSLPTEHDRDVNAAINLKNMAVSFTVTACGEESAGLSQPALE